MNKQSQIVRKLIEQDYLNNTSNNIDKIKSIDRDTIDLSTRLLVFFYLIKDKEQKERKELIKRKISIITENIYREIFNKIDSKSDDDEIYDKIFDLINVFYPVCDIEHNTSIDSSSYPRCEGRFCKDTHLVSYLIGPSDYEIKFENKNENNPEHYRTIFNTYFNKEFIRCPKCKKTNVSIQKDKNNKEIALCVCGFALDYKLEDIYWCFSSKCMNACSFKNDSSSPITINHLLGDVDEISYLSAWFNRLLGILPRCFCFTCNKILIPDYKNTNQKNPTAYRILYYKCGNNHCKEYDKTIYLNHCSNKRCGEPIDSRICTSKCKNGFSICQHCYACCNQSIFDRKGISKSGHLEDGKIFCPDCSNLMMVSNYDDEFYCGKCKKTKPIRYNEHRLWENNLELKQRVYSFNQKEVRIKSIIKNK